MIRHIRLLHHHHRLKHLQKKNVPIVLRVRHHGSKPANMEIRAAERLLKEPDCAYLIPLYVKDVGGHHYRLTKWFQQEGDAVNESTALCEIDTDEFAYDFPASENGYLAQCTVAEGDAVEEDQMFALLVQSVEELDDYRSRLGETCKVLIEEEEQEMQHKKGTLQNEESATDMVQRVLKATGMEQYKDEFTKLVEDDGFDTPGALREVTEDDLEDVGVRKKGHRRALIRALEE